MFRTGFSPSCLPRALLLLLLAIFGSALLAHAQAAHFSYAQVAVATGLNTPQGVAVDSSGNVYIADLGNNRLVKETLSGGSYTQSVVVSGLVYADGVAVDASGNLYIADSGQQGILKETLSGGAYTQSVIGSGFYPNAVAIDNSGNLYATATANNRLWKETLVAGTYAQSIASTLAAGPRGVAVDSSGNVYVTQSNGDVVEETPSPSPSGYTPSTLVTLNSPTGIVVDPSGNLYIADDSADKIFKETLSSGSYLQSIVESGLSAPFGMAIDPVGNLYVSDAYSGGRVLILQIAGVNFGSQSVGSAVATLPVTFTFDTGGTLASYSVLTQGIAGLDFVDAGGGTCVAATDYTASATCTVNVTFTPKLAGVRYGAVTLYTATGVPFATAYIHGIGIGPQLAFAPSTLSTIVSSASTPYGVAVDAVGTIYIADSGNARVLKETPSAGVYIESIAASSLGTPYDVAVDGSGNLFIADIAFNQVLEVQLLASGSYATTPVAIGTGLSTPNSVALDGNGNVYIADSSNNRVLKETLSAGVYTQSTVADGSTMPYPLQVPKGVAVDASGNVYIANTDNYQVLEESPTAAGGYTQSLVATLAAGYDSPFGIAVDGSGNIYFADAATNQVLKVTPASPGTYTASVALSNGQSPYGVAVDGRGNLIATTPYSPSGYVARLDVADPPSLTFATTAVGSTSSDSPQTVTFENIGNAALTFSVPPSGTNPALSSGFVYGANATCPQLGPSSSATTLAAGTNCTEMISFTPQVSGAVSGTAITADDNFNIANATQSVALSGMATAAPVVVSVASSSVPYGTANVTLTATISYSGPTPSGVVTFLINSNPNSTQGGSCTAASGIRTCTAIYNLVNFSAGSNTILVSEAADASYSAGSGSGNLTITRATPVVSVAAQSTTYGNAATTLSATLTYAGGAAPTGAVTFAVDAGSATTGVCVGATSPILCTATYPTSSFTAGNHTITVSAAADVNYTTASASGALTILQAVPVITWPAPAGIPAGTALSATQLDATASVPGSFAYTPAAGTLLTPGAHSLSVTFTPADATDYTTVSASVQLTVIPFAPAPTFVPGAGAYTVAQTVSIVDSLPGASIYYTTNGRTPTTASRLYTGPINVSATETLEAIASAAGYEVSSVSMAMITIYKPPVCSLAVQGTAVALSVIALASCTDPQGQGLTTTLNWGDGTMTAASTRNLHTYAVAGTYTVVLTAVDASGLTGTAQQQATPNQTPVCTLGVVQGTASTYAARVTASCTDPQGQPLSLTIDWGDGSGPLPALNNAANGHTYPGPDTPSTTPYKVTLTAIDTSGLVGSAEQPVTILPLAPPVMPGGTAAVAITPQAASGTQVTFICASVSSAINGVVATNVLPSQYGISCSAPVVTLSSAPTPVNVMIQTTSGGSSTAALRRKASALLYAVTLPFPALASFVLGCMWPSGSRRRRRDWGVASIPMLALCFGLTSCGGSFTPPSVPSTPVGQYFITIVEVAVTSPVPTGFVQTSLIVPLPIGAGGG